ncbi:MAG: hypothetical protein Kow006_17840 [Gammaproteobacteria bacterium]
MGLTNRVDRVPPRLAIYGAVGLLSASLLWLSGWVAWEARRNLNEALLSQTALRAAVGLRQANFYYAMERGWGAALLASPAKQREALRANLSTIRSKADRAASPAETLITDLLQRRRSPLLNATLEQFLRSRSELARWRSLVDRGDPAERLPPSVWIEAMTRHIEQAQLLVEGAATHLVGLPLTLRDNWAVASWLASLAEHAGRERAIVAAHIAARRPMDTASRKILGEYRRKVELTLQQGRSLLEAGALSPEATARIRFVVEDFTRHFGAERERILAAGATGDYPLTAERWLALSTDAIDRVIVAADALHDEVDSELAGLVRYRQWQRLLGSLGLLITPLMALLGFAGANSGARRLEAQRDRARRHLATARREMRQRRRTEAAMRSLVEENPVGVLVLADDGSLLYANPAARWMVGERLDVSQDGPPRLPRLDGVRTRIPIRRPDGGSGQGELTVTATRWHGRPAHRLMILDVSEVQAAERMLRQASGQDPLTGLPNHGLFLDRLRQALQRAHRFGQRLRLLIIDLDRFHLVNETLGHSIGDQLLRRTADRLRQGVRETDTVARLGADRFAVVLEHLPDEAASERVLEKISEALQADYRINGHSIHSSASIGFCDYPGGKPDAERLLHQAEIALRTAKRGGGGTLVPFEAAWEGEAKGQPRLEVALAGAVGRSELSLHYQPRLDLRSGAITGMEALCRWEHSELGQVPPGKFIPVAEETGLILAIGEWALREACRQTHAWHREGLPAVTVSVNVSALQLAHPGFVECVARVLEESGLPPGHLELEITESALIHNAESAAEKLHRLRDLGVHCSIDDFGTGYSSLSYLRMLPIHALKVDRSFVRQLWRDPGNATITTAVISMARDLGLRVVAEGVETAEDAAYLQQKRCHEIQGYFVARPLPPGNFAALLREPLLPDLHRLTSDEPWRTLLVLDDESEVLRALPRVLSHEGYNLLSACHPDEALRLLAHHRAGLIISDLRMPEMSGVEFLKRCRRLHPEATRILLCSEDDQASVLASRDDAGIDRYLTKPWDDEVLRRAIRQALKARAPEQPRVAGATG